MAQAVRPLDSVTGRAHEPTVVSRSSRFRQPPVVAEIAAGMLVGAVALGGDGLHQMLLALKLIGETGLILFVVGTAHEIRIGIDLGRPADPRVSAMGLAALMSGFAARVPSVAAWMKGLRSAPR